MSILYFPKPLNKSAPTFADLTAGTGNWSDQKEIGRGKHGVVYKCHLDDGVFAVKRIRNTKQGRQEVEDLLTINTDVRSGNVLRVISTYATSDHLYLIHPFVGGGDVENALSTGRQFDQRRRYKVAAGVARAIAAMHNGGWVHRDVKAPNVLLGTDDAVVLGDMGFSQRSGTRWVGEKKRGTSGYISPEYRADTGAVYATPENDAYAFGVLLLHLLTNVSGACTEEDCRDKKSLIDRYRSGEVQSDKSVWNVDSAEYGTIASIADICTRNDPNERYTMKMVAAILNKNIPT